MRTIFTVAAVVAAVVAGFLLWRARPAAPPAVAPAPQAGVVVASVEFPVKIDADGEPVRGVVHFQAATGNVTYADFQVVTAGFFVPFGFDPEVRDTPQGEFEFYVTTLVPQQVTLSVVLTDDTGQTSEPVAFSFTAAPTQPTTGGD